MTELLKGIFSVSLIFLGMGAILVPIFFVIRHRDRTVKLPIDREKLNRLPGFGIQKQIQELQFDILSAMLMSVIVVTIPFAFEGLRGYLDKGTFPLAFVGFIVLGPIYFVVKTYRSMTRLTKLRLGHTAELATAAELMRLQGLGYQVFHDIQADGFNIDHLVVGINGVFAIETKGRHKWYSDKKNESNGGQHKAHELFYRDGKLVFPSWTETAPIEQAQRQAKWVSEWLTKAVGQSIPVIPVLVFPGWMVKSQTKPPFPIINHKQVAITLPKMNAAIFTQEQVNAIAYQIMQRCLQGKP
ncbi:NERD domain protein [Shewanella baltica OS183]|uniref:nuclease-related domain-containing protein n=1 Tax=Shewanella baltica TaxID=62322 RepID=UPI0001E10C5C|nr:nuclease-related domain-containing protein [Shewanella baltica]AEG11433.1 NERD domain protein [Shewanella baltica BA175]EHQ15035.1 NERD domain protein [Shewanella baltica OS183]